MRTSLLPTALLAIGFAIAPVICLAQQPTASPASPATPASGDANDQLATIAGTVLSANTGEPLKKAHVDLSQTGTQGDAPNKQPFSAITESAAPITCPRTMARTNLINQARL